VLLNGAAPPADSPDDPMRKKSVVVLSWMLGYEFTDTLALITEKTVYILASAKKGARLLWLCLLLYINHRLTEINPPRYPPLCSANTDAVNRRASRQCTKARTTCEIEGLGFTEGAIDGRC